MVMLQLSLWLTRGLLEPTAGLEDSVQGKAQPAGTHTAHGSRIQVLVSALLVPVCPQPADLWDQPTCEPGYEQCRQSEVWRWSVILILQMFP